jgi:hypothetical protein
MTCACSAAVRDACSWGNGRASKASIQVVGLPSRKVSPGGGRHATSGSSQEEDQRNRDRDAVGDFVDRTLRCSLPAVQMQPPPAASKGRARTKGSSSSAQIP